MNNALKAVRKGIDFPSMGSSQRYNLRQEGGCRRFLSKVIPRNRGGLYGKTDRSKKKKVSNWLRTAGLEYTEFLENPSRGAPMGRVLQKPVIEKPSTTLRELENSDLLCRQAQRS